MNAAAKLAPQTTEKNNARRDQLILEFMHLVRPIAGSVQKSISVHTELDDLVHAGTMGLFDAATKYQDDKEVPFPVYAKHRIRGAILDSLRELDWASRDARRHYKQMESVTRELTAKLQRIPTQVEIAEAMGLDARRWQNLMIDFRSLGMNATRQSTADSDDMPAREVPSAPANNPDQVYARSEMRRKLQLAMQGLSQRHQEVVTLYYMGDMTMKEIGTKLGVNESRVSQIHKSALAKMQTTLGGNGISSAAVFCQ